MKELLRKVKRLEIRTRRLVESTFAGEYHSAFKGQGLEFDEVRPYQYGDDIRSIDWNVTAKAGVPFIKIFKEEREQTLFVLFDISGSEDFGTEGSNKLQVGTEIAAIMAFSALKNSDKIGLATFNDQIVRHFPPKKGKKHVLAIIRALLQHKWSGAPTNIKTAVDFVRNTLKRRSVFILISDFIDQDYMEALVKLSQRHEVILVRLFNPAEVMKFGTGIVPFVDKETGSIVWRNSSNPLFRQNISKRFDEIEEQLQDLARKNQMGYLPITTDQDYIHELEKFFRKRNSRRKRG